MTDHHYEITLHFARAYETLDEASLLHNTGHLCTTINRLYYACFYAVSGVLLAQGYTAIRHAGVMTLFDEHIVQDNLIDRAYGRFYHQLFQARRYSDYDIVFSPDPQQIIEWLAESRAFVDLLHTLVAPSSSDKDN